MDISGTANTASTQCDFHCVSSLASKCRDVHGNGEDWDAMGPMRFPWEWK